MKGLFITGSSTGVGKTHVAGQIISQIRPQLKSLKVRKPVESGCTVTAEGLLPADGYNLYARNGKQESLDIITPYRFEAALAPDQAARRENKTVTLQQLETAVSNHVDENDFLLVEGAGGFYSPIAEDGLNADLAKLLGLEMIVVIEDQLGAINQALLTLRAIEHEGLKLKALILNRVTADSTEQYNNQYEIQRRVTCPVHVCAYAQSAEDFQLLG